MKCFNGYLASELSRVFKNKKIYISIIMYMVFVKLILECDAMANGRAPWEAFNALIIITGFSNLNRLLFLTGAVSTATTYADDCSDKYVYLQIIRGNVNRYILSKIIICGMSAFFVSFVSLNIYSLILSFTNGMGVVNSGNYNAGNVFYDYMSGSFPYMAVAAKIFLFSLVSAVYAVMGLAFTAYINGRFAAYFSTVFVSIIMETFFKYLPKSISLFAIQSGNSAYNTGTTMMLLLSVSVSLGYIILGGIVFGKRVKRRIHNEIC